MCYLWEIFQPQPSGYNAKYCARVCSTKAYRGRHIIVYDPAYRARYFQEVTKQDPQKYKQHCDRGTSARHEVRQWLAEYKVSHGCVDCGYDLHYAALQLDHEGKKSVEISAARSSIKRLQKEVKKGKCVVRCANCHSIRTWERKQK